MNDERQRLKNLGLDPVSGVPNISRFQGPAYSFRVNHLSGVVEKIPTTTGGVDFFQEANSRPAAATPDKTSALDFVAGGPAVVGSVQRATPAQRTLQSIGIDFLALDPNSKPVPNSDRRDRRGTESSAAIFG